MASPSELFELWQEADAIATDAERLLAAELDACSKGIRRMPDRIQIEVVDALRATAHARLRAALRAFEPPKL